MCYVGRGTEQKHSPETLGIALKEPGQDSDPRSLHCLLESVCDTDACTPSSFLNPKALPGCSQVSPAQSPLVAQITNEVATILVHQEDSGGLAAAEINTEPPHRVCEWPGHTATDQLCLYNFGSQLCVELLKQADFCLEFKGKNIINKLELS